MKTQKVISLILILFLIIEILSPIIPRGVFASENADINDGQTQVANEEQTGEEISREYEIKEEETWDISENGDGSVIARWTLSDKTLRISGNGEMKNWLSYDGKEDWHNSQYTKIIENVVIEDGVTNIGQSAFYKCSSLTDIEISGGVTKIDVYAFKECSSLINIDISENVTYIGYEVFSECSRLETINVNANNENYMSENGILFNKDKTEIITYPAGKDDIKVYQIPEEVTKIGTHAFYRCSNLTSIEIPEEVTEIRQSAFEGCSSLTDIEIPEGVTEIAYATFEGCNSLINVEIPEGITEICGNAFDECSSLVSIEIPEGVTRIGDYAFYGCSSLASIEIPEGVTQIGESAFEECSSLTNIEIPESVTEIGGWAFSECNSLISIEIPESVTEIGDHALYGCSKLIIYVEADSVEHKYAEENEIGYILNGEASTVSTEYEVKEEETWDISENGDGSVIAKWSLENRTLNISGIGKMKDWESTYKKENWNYFRYLKIIENVVIEDEITNIGDYAFYCSSITSIQIPEGVTEIGEGTFEGCSRLTDVKIPEGVTQIGESAFEGCSSLTSIEIPESVVEIGIYAFEECSSLINIDIPKNVTYIGSTTFVGCSKLEAINVNTINENYISENGILFSKDKTEIIKYPAGKDDIEVYQIPEEVTEIAWYAFEGCSSLTDIEIPERVTEIRENAFEGCSSLTGIEIPEGVIRIGDRAFRRCSNLASIEIPKGVTRIGSETFYGCSSLASIEIPEGVTEIGDDAFYGCSSLKGILLRGNLIHIGILSNDIPIIYTRPNSMAHKYAEENEQGYVLDEKGPNIKILVDKLITNKKQTLTIPVEVKDNYEIVGVKEETIKYAISDSNVQVPPDEEFTNNVIDGKITYEMQEGKKYIWVMAEDNLGNRATAVSEEINLDTKAPELEITYTPSGKTTQNVIVTIKANEEIQEIEGWTISADKRILTKEYDENMEETIIVKDMLGNETIAQISVQNIVGEMQKGDINIDDKIDITDIILLKRHLIAGNRTNWKLTGDNLELADMNENGKVDISDLLLLKREVAQNI